MAFDIEMIKAVYDRLEKRVSQARKLTGKPLSASEKILYSHLWDGTSDRAYTRGTDYVDLQIETDGDFTIRPNSPTQASNYAEYDGDSNWDFYSDERLKKGIVSKAFFYKFYAWKMTALGISSQPVVSAVGPVTLPALG